MAVLNSSRIDGAIVDMSMAMCDAKVLFEAIESGKSIDKKTIISLLSLRTTAQLNAILLCYKQLYGPEFSKSLKREKCGMFGKELCTIITCVQHPEKYFVKQLRRALKNGNIRDTLTRVIVTRSGISLKDIKVLGGLWRALSGANSTTITKLMVWWLNFLFYFSSVVELVLILLQIKQ